ncbi:MAG: cytochrome c biogenesis protein CcdA [Actinomycetaceae bacterium]|nr:cytochrome c biogenesis protein CcdA [Actinomycetaceae bacterium]
MSGSSIAIAYAGGLITLLAPCAALLLPSFFAYAFTTRRKLIARTGVFFLGLLLGLVPLGALAGSVGAFMRARMETITLVGGVIVIIFGIVQFLNLHLPRLGIAARLKTLGKRKNIEAQLAKGFKSGNPAKRGEAWSTAISISEGGRQGDVAPGVFASAENQRGSSPIAVLLLGFTYGLAGAGCTGPILGAVLTTAGLSGSSWQGGLLMAFYAAGMFTPVFALALGWEAISSRWKDALKPRSVTILGIHTTVGNIVSGVIFVALGIVLIFTGGSANLPSILNVEAQAAFENAATVVLNGVPSWLFVALAVAVVALFAAWLYDRRLQGLAKKSVADMEELSA